MENEVVVKSKGVTGSTLKIIAIIAMFIDHFGVVFFESYLNNAMTGNEATSVEASLAFVQNYGKIYLIYMILRCIGRFGFPIFVFLLIEGFTHTHNIKKYITNMAVFAIVSEIPFNLSLDHTLLSYDHQNVFFTLLIGILVLTGIKYIGEDKKWSEKLVPLYYVAGLGFGATVGYLVAKSEISSFMIGFGTPIESKYYVIGCAVILFIVMLIKGFKLTADQKNTFTVATVVIAAGVFLAELLNTDYSGWGVFTIVVMYYFKENYKRRMGFGVLALTLMSGIEAFAFFMMIPATHYNGKRGLKSKYFFYIFYPAHLLILYLIAYAIGLVSFGIR